MLVRQLAPGLAHVDLEVIGDRLQQLRVEEVRLAPGRDRAVRQRERRVRRDQVGVGHQPGAEPGAGRAGTVRGVEGEVARLRLRHAGAVVGAGEVLAHQPFLATIHRDQEHRAMPQPQRRLQRVDQPRPLVGSQHKPVDDHLDVVLLVLLERDGLVEGVDLAVDPDPDEAALAKILEQGEVLALAPPDHRAEQHELGARRHLLDLVGHLVDRLLGDRPPADRAVRLADPGEEEAQVVVDLGHGADRRARVLRGALLVDRDRRRQTLDGVDVRLLHLAEELAGVGGERLDVAALALGVDGVEGERRLPRAGEAGEDDQPVAGYDEVDALEVVLAGTANRYPVDGHLGVLLRQVDDETSGGGPDEVAADLQPAFADRRPAAVVDDGAGRPDRPGRSGPAA